MLFRSRELLLLSFYLLLGKTFKNIKPGKMAQLLFDEYKIFTVAIDGANVHGCRISPNIFTTTEELDSLVNAVTELSKVNS